MENVVLIFSVKLFGKRNVFKGDFFADILLQETFLSLKFINRSLNAAHDRASPGNRS